MGRGRGYRGSSDYFRYLIACHRPRPKARSLSAFVLPAGEETCRATMRVIGED
jgi:hypothetical protein